MSFAVDVQPYPAATIAAGSAKKVGAVLKQLGARACLVVTDKGLTGAGVTGQVKEYITSAGIDCVVFDDVQANPTMSIVEAGIAVLNSMPAGTFLVSLGGGSSMDAAKAISVIGPDGGVTAEDIAQYCMVPELAEGSETINMATMMPQKMAKKPSAKIIAIPTTSGTASETNGAAVISDDRAEVHRKLIFSYPGAAAVQTILDPELTLGLPAYPTATCGMDALTHSIEALTSARQNPYSDAVALGSIKLVAEWLPVLMKDLSNLDARLHIMTASHMAGIAFGISGLGICHAVGHPLSALLNKAHGQTLSTMLPHVMEFNLPVRAAKYALVAEAFGVKDDSADDETNARAAIKAVAELSISVGTAMSIEQMGGTPEIIAEAVKQAITDLCILSNARPATSADILGMYEAAMSDPVLYPVEAAVASARL